MYITDTVKLTAGVRYSEETKSYIRTNFNRLTGAVASVESNRKSFHSTNPRLGIEWRPIPGLLLFATATSGFKSGGFNPRTEGRRVGQECVSTVSFWGSPYP